jgi:16S rRNA U1498 N3-methylase RsmE
LFVKEGVHPITLGSHILRAETAAIVACGILCL